MKMIFSSSEIVELGVQIEQNGKDFYEALARKSPDALAKKVFITLARAEAKHRAVFKRILESVNEKRSQELRSDEYSAYMQSLAKDCVFTEENKGAHYADKVKSEKQAIELAIAFEKDSILFYQAMKESVPVLERTALDRLITEEQLHLRQLYNLERKLLQKF